VTIARSEYAPLAIHGPARNVFCAPCFYLPEPHQVIVPLTRIDIELIFVLDQALPGH
jgi:hypothetical protein